MTKNAVARSWPGAASADDRFWSAYPDGDNPNVLIPSWVPAPGASATYTSDGSVLTNKFRDVVVGDAFYPSKIRNAYSGPVLHPTWRSHRGGLVVIGGGHANTNHNGVYMVTFNHDTMYFERVIDATAWTAGETGDISAEFNSYGEKIGSSPLQITQGHSYNMRLVIDGKVVCVLRQAFMVTGGGDTEAQAYHTLDLTNPSTASSARAWVRETDTLGAWANTAPPGLMATLGGRIFFATGGGNAPTQRWFDIASKSWVTGSGAGWNYPSSDSDGGDRVTGVMFPVPSRNLVIGAWRAGGVLQLQYIDATAGQPAAATATLGSSLSLPVEGGKAVTWCSHSNRILVYGVTSNTDKCYEIEIPTALTDPWPVTSAVISGPAIDPVAIMTRAGWGCQYHDGIKAVVFLHDLKNTSSTPDTIDRVTVHRPRNT